MSLGTFPLLIDGERLGGTEETSALLRLTIQGRGAIRDEAEDQFIFPNIPGRGANISLPYTIELPTDVTSGVSTEIGYSVTVTTANGGVVSADFAAQAATTTPVPLTDLAETVVTPISDLGSSVAAAEAAQAAAETAAASVNREQASGVAGLTAAGKLYEVRIPDRLSDATLSATFAPKPADVKAASDLRTFRAALAARNVDILTIGDSITEGTGPTLIENRWQSKFRDGLRARYGVTGGRGYVPSKYGVTPAPADVLWTATGGVIDGTILERGLGKRNMRLNAAGHKMTLSVPVGVTDVDIFIAAVNTETSWYKPTIDGVAGANVNVQPLSGATRRDIVFNVASGLNPAVTHTIDIEWVLGNVWLSGAMLYNGDRTTGIRLWDGARHGQQSAFFANTADSWWKTVNTIQPDLVFISLGRNDWSAGTSVATFKSNIQTIISEVRNQTTNDPSIVLVPVYGTAASGTPVAPWSDYVAAMKDLAATDPGEVSVLGIYSRLGTITDAASNALGITSSDFIHPSNLGSQMIADAAVDFMTAPV